jgi:hypothetical protein
MTRDGNSPLVAAFVAVHQLLICRNEIARRLPREPQRATAMSALDQTAPSGYKQRRTGSG